MHDADSTPTIGFFVLFVAVMSASAAAWYWIYRRWQSGRPLVAFKPRRPAPWGLVDAVLILCGWLLLQGLLPALLRQLTGGKPWEFEAPVSPEDLQILLLSALAADVLAGICALLWLWLVRGARSGDLGMSALRLPGDVRRGAVAFAAVSVPIYAIQVALVQFFPSHHPLVQLLQETRDVVTTALSVVLAAVVAPIAEEVLFRLVLQGGLEAAEARAIAARRPRPAQLGAAPSTDLPSWEPTDNAYAAPRACDDPASTRGNSEGACGTSAGAGGNSAEPLPGSSAADASPGESREQPETRVRGLPPGAWPILISSALFALMHFNHGPDPIPLFVLSVALGYLYRRTHRLLPSIVVHILLNSCSLATLWLQSGN